MFNVIFIYIAEFNCKTFKDDAPRGKGVFEKVSHIVIGGRGFYKFCHVTAQYKFYSSNSVIPIGEEDDNIRL